MHQTMLGLTLRACTLAIAISLGIVAVALLPQACDTTYSTE